MQPLPVASIAIVTAFLACPAHADSDLFQAVAMSGLTPAALTACGVGVGDVLPVVAQVQGSPECRSVLLAGGSLQEAENNLRAVVATVDPQSEEGTAALDQARAALESARSAFTLAIDAFRNRAEQPLSTSQRQRLANWWAAPADLPPEFRPAPWAAPDLKALQAALAEERLTRTTGSPLSSSSSDTLLGARARDEVIDAAALLQTGRAAVTAAFLQAVGQ